MRVLAVSLLLGWFLVFGFALMVIDLEFKSLADVAGQSCNSSVPLQPQSIRPPEPAFSPVPPPQEEVVEVVPGSRIIGTAALQGGRPVVAPLPADHLAHRLDHGSVQAGSSPDWLDSYGLACQERCMLAACRPGTTKSV